MTNKKNSSPADILIDSLVEDAKSEDTSSGSDNLFSQLAKNASIGLDPSPVPVDDFPRIDAPEAGEGKYEGPSAGDGGFQSHDEIFNSAPPVSLTPNSTSKDEKTIQLNQTHQSEQIVSQSIKPKRIEQERVYTPPKAAVQSVMVQVDASLVQAENLKYAQERIMQLEREVDELRQENEEISSAAEIVKNRVEQLMARERQLIKERDERDQSSMSEMTILKGQLQHKEAELVKAQNRIEEYELRLKNDFKKVRVRERELENRLELVKAEKTTLMRAKDDAILELKRKNDQLQSEIDNYREKCLELNKTLESHKEQFKRTVRALKLALTNLEAKEEDVIPLKKAE